MWATASSSTGRPAATRPARRLSFCTAGRGPAALLGFVVTSTPAIYRIVLFDQRGAGRSIPRVGEQTDLSANMTSHLIGDIEQLRSYLGIERWLVWGVSWGVTLA